MFAELIFWIIYIYKMLQNISFQLKKKKKKNAIRPIRTELITMLQSSFYLFVAKIIVL
jgi:hypothetical protein